MQEILDYLRVHGRQLDAEIAVATGIPLAEVRRRIRALSKRGDVVTCHATHFHNGQKSEGLFCRVVGSTPCASPVRKPRMKRTPKAKA